MMQSLVLLLWLVSGILGGIAYFTSIWWSARCVADGGRMTVMFGLSLVRLAMLGGVLALASFQGAGPLLAMALGVVLARFGVMRRLRVITQ